MAAPPQGPGGGFGPPPQQSVHPGFGQGPPPAGYPVGPPPQQKKNSSCLVIGLIIGGVLVVFGGIFAALAIYGMNRYLAASKTSEAKNTVGAISRAAAAAYEREQLDSLEEMDTAASRHALCTSANPVPATVPAGRKYMSAPSDWGGSAVDGWECLRFTMSYPQYYQYNYNAGGGYLAPQNPKTPSGKGFEAAARGDLDGDGVPSTFARTGEVDSSGMLRTSTQLFIENEFE